MGCAHHTGEALRLWLPCRMPEINTSLEGYFIHLNESKLYLKNFSSLLCNFWLWSQFQESAGKGGGRTIVLEFEAKIQRRSQRQDLMDWLEFRMGKVGSHLTATFLIFEALLRQFLASRFHAKTDNVLPTNGNQLLGLAHLLFIVHNEKWDVKQK